MRKLYKRIIICLCLCTVLQIAGTIRGGFAAGQAAEYFMLDQVAESLTNGVSQIQDIAYSRQYLQQKIAVLQQIMKEIQTPSEIPGADSTFWKSLYAERSRHFFSFSQSQLFQEFFFQENPLSNP